jgi:hypothetical protein
MFLRHGGTLESHDYCADLQTTLPLGPAHGKEICFCAQHASRHGRSRRYWSMCALTPSLTPRLRSRRSEPQTG